MKRLTYFVVILALIYGGYWFVGSNAVENGAKTQLEKMANEGWDVSYGDLGTKGFPSRFDTNLTDISLATPDRQLRYAADMVQVLALSYQPNRVIVALPPQQTVTIDDTSFQIESEGLRASVGVAANTALSLDNIAAEASSIAIAVTSDLKITANSFLTALRESGGLPNTYDAYFTLKNITAPQHVLAQLDPSGELAHSIDVITIDGSFSLDRPLDRHTLPKWETEPGQLRGVTLRSLDLKWGPFSITGDGSFTVDETGTPEGTITFTANDWQGMLDAAVSAGLVPDQYQFMARSMGQTLAQGSEELVLPITVQNGNLSVGPLPLGPAPKFN